ncbi:DUF3631 domain-containing protein [Streptacidiphilus neutrinimicus]|uniref:DUF3631 domain-containing protein n=1 Tax=Streptacidiphilus neutrinimicus TaxID=105420 RepID=UPI0005AA165A|nr:DUF3631 domain-containing protein [Streptacidiphilus neutrinimicus]
MTAFEDLSRALAPDTSAATGRIVLDLVENLAGAIEALTAHTRGIMAAGDDVRDTVAETVLALVRPCGHVCPPPSPLLGPNETSLGRELLDECVRIALALPEEELLLEELLVDLLRADLSHPWSRQRPHGLGIAQLAEFLGCYGVRPIPAPSAATEARPGQRAYRRTDLLFAQPGPPDPGDEAALRDAA